MANEYLALGTYSRPVNTTSADAQCWFDRGLRWAYAFNHDESVRCFTRAIEFDPECAMAHWGIAYARGPNYNKAWIRFDKSDLKATCHATKAALEKACALTAGSKSAEAALITATVSRFPPGDSKDSYDDVDFNALNLAYADAMRYVYQEFPDDVDVIALFSEALMCLSPRAFWDIVTGEPIASGSVEARTVLEKGMSFPTSENYPHLFHLYIHLMEMSPFPLKALPMADSLRRLVPEASHLLHMVSHIDSTCGDYRRAIDTNREAMAADDKYFNNGSRPFGMYTLYRAHNIFALAYSAMISGRQKDAIAAAQRLSELLTPELFEMTSPPMADWAESYVGTIAHVLVRFGRWEEILQLEIPTRQDLYCSTTAVIFYARGIALSVLGRTDEAVTQQRYFEIARSSVPTSRLNSLPARQVDVLKVAAAMLEGEIQYRKGNFGLAFASLQEAVSCEDAIPYTEPPPWMQPARHALGALLLEQNHVQQAEAVYRDDLGFGDLPRRRCRINNVWGLQGLHECLMRNGKHEQAQIIRLQRDIAMASADVHIDVSCLCRKRAWSEGAACCSEN
ncbi:unnamed protein product [Penicillium egyptiacum]|uniref:Tetratricopeptide repeat domain protein n=1 Tax=Penicillium egyptiacum TaxID=1303716 RepID=A0A9W4P5M6_9EURO|nr:unnamed protein product [Penicillium egyptiacum]